MIRVASLYLPQLPIERLRRTDKLRQPERPVRPPERAPLTLGPRLADPADDDPGPCSVPRGGGWRPGARWARDDRPPDRQAEIDALPAHQRPTMRQLGRRSEAAGHPFKAMAPDDGAAAGAAFLPARSLLAERPTVLVMRTGQREMISAACPAARALGLGPGLPAAQARALVTDLDMRDAALGDDQAFIERLALHAVAHWTPAASVAGSDGLWLDLTGTAHLFGGEMRFCVRLLRFLARLGFTASIAVAGTPGAAHALARFGGEAITIVPPAAETEAIAGLPLAALRLDAPALTAAARFGLEHIADLYPIPRGPLAKRLGLHCVERLDQARGIVAEPIAPLVPVALPQVERRLLEPIVTADAIGQVIGDLIADLTALLLARGIGVRTAVLTCLRVDGEVQRIGLGTARATRDAKHLIRMFAMRIERIDPGLGIEAMTLAAPGTEPLAPQAMAASFAGARHAPDLAPLVDQLAGRVGDAALFRMAARESDVPERAAAAAGPLSAPAGWPGWRRPVRLLGRPEPLSNVVALLPDHPPRRFVWRGTAYRVVAGDGPERVHGEWWRSERELWAVRDYFCVETDGGARFWLFRRGDGVDAPTGDLSWHMHGAFG